MTRTLLVGSGQFLDALGDGLRALGHDVTASDVGGLIGTADLVVHVPKVPNGPTDLVNLTPDNWVAACEAPLDEAVAVAALRGDLVRLRRLAMAAVKARHHGEV